LITTILAITNVFDLNESTIVFIGFIPISLLLGYSVQSYRGSFNLSITLDKISNENIALFYINSLQSAIDFSQSTKTVDLKIYGLIQNHIHLCNNQECFCKNPEISKGDLTFLCGFMKTIYEELLAKFNNSPLLHMHFAIYVFSEIHNTHSALVELGTASNLKPSFGQQFQIFCCMEIIKNEISKIGIINNQQNFMQLTSVIEYEELEQKCINMIQRTTQLQIDFWRHLASQAPDLNILNKLGEKIFACNEETEKHWEKLNEVNSRNTKMISMYGTFLTEIRKNVIKGSELTLKYFFQSDVKKEQRKFHNQNL